MSQRVEEPVFVMGFPRTGTTLLYSILYRHSAFHPAIRMLHPEYSSLVECQFYRRFFNPALSLWKTDDERSLRTWFASDTTRFTQFLVQIFRAFHIEAATARGCERILEKTPDNLLICQLMVSAFPRAKLLCLSRDARDTMASFRRRRTQQPGPEGQWLDLAYDLDRFIATWNRQQALWQRFAKEFPLSGNTVRFSTLTTSPEAAVQSILEFIGEKMEPQLLEGERPTARTSPIDGYWSHVPVENTDVWHGYVEEWEAERITKECHPFDS